MNDITAPLAITMGDPAGCGPAITAAAWTELRSEAAPFFVVGAPALYSERCPVAEIRDPGEAARVFTDALPVLPLAMEAVPSPGEPDASTAPAILQSIETAVALCLEGTSAGVVTNPINKALLYGAGFNHPGHTEFIADLCGSATPPVMMLTAGRLRVALATIHLPLREVPDALTVEGLIQTARIVQGDLKRRFGLEHPRIAFSGLNPHAGESGTIGREEADIINPAASALRAEAIDVTDARPGDTVFHEALHVPYDAVIAMTHDQGLIPIKLIDFWGGVNTTLGLPIVRTSPDHGTAYDAAAQGIARADSLIAAIRLAADMAARRG